MTVPGDINGNEPGETDLSGRLDRVRDNFPAEILETPTWCYWDKTPRQDGRPSKKPLSPATGREAKTNDESTFGTFDAACSAALHDPRAGGVGCLLTGQPRIFVDLDHVIDLETGEVNAKALALLERLSPTYIEVSPGGDGLHVVHTGQKPDDWRSQVKDAFGMGTALEVYDGSDKRYFTATGSVWANEPIAAATETDLEALAAFMRRQTKQKPAPAPVQPRQDYGRTVAEDYQHDLARARWGLLEVRILSADGGYQESFFRVLAALKGAFPGDGLEIAHAWARLNPATYNGQEIDSKWGGIGGTNMNCLVGMFEDARPGWQSEYRAQHPAPMAHTIDYGTFGDSKSQDSNQQEGTRQEQRSAERAELKAKANPWKRFSLDEYLERKNGLWSIHGLYREGQVVLIGAFPSVGKSTVATGLIAATLYGSPWCGLKALGGSVVAFVGEGRLGFVRRLEAERRKRGGPWPDDRYFELIDFEMPLSSSDGQIQMRRLLQVITDEQGHAPALVVVDTMASHWAAEEDSQEHTGPFMKAMGQLAVEFGCSILIVHHTTKVKGKYVPPELQDIRGSGALVGGADVVLGLHSTPDNSGVVLRTLKTKDDDPGPDICLQRESVPLGCDEQGDPLTAALFVSGDLGHAMEQQTRVEAAQVERAEQLETRLLAGMRELDGKISSKDTLFKRVEGKTGDLRGAFGRLLDTDKVLHLGASRSRAYYLPTHSDVPALRGDAGPKHLTEKVAEARAGVCVTKEPKGGGAEPPAPLSPGDRPEAGGDGGRNGAEGRSKTPPTIDGDLPEQPKRRRKKTLQRPPASGGAA